MNEGSSQEFKAAQALFSGPCDFMLSVAALKQLPEAILPEIAFAGRSNVGKSSLINTLTNRKTLAKTSGTPGRTQQLNFFDLGGQLYMVDMPGYGYAKVSRSIKEKWERLIRSYLRGRASLRCVFILIDSRHGLKPSDEELMKMLDECAVSYRLVLTKTDKIKASALEEVTKKTQTALKKHPAAFPELVATSSEKGMGIPELRALIASYG